MGTEATGGTRVIPVRITVVKVNQKLTNFPWALLESEGHDDGPMVHTLSQARFESEAAAEIAYRNYRMRGAE
jgi:hypothetical protein